MEQLVLGIFQEQLAKVIVGFRKEQVNANLLNGKGEIRDVSLNCSFLNQAIARVSPYVELEEIHVSRLGFHVTSWTNLRHAPIIVDIGRITARVQEPLQCLPKHQRKRIRMITETELIQMILHDGFKPMRGKGSYGLVDRIVDNLTIEIESFRLEYQTWGKFKTRRMGPWTPPLLQVEWKNLKVVMVDEDGNEGTPHQVWAHNRNRRDSYFLYKKVSGECQVRLWSNGSSPNEEPNHNDATDDKGMGESCKNTQNNNHNSKKERKGYFSKLAEMKMEVQMAVQRRLRDGAVLAVQVDVTVPKVDVQVDSTGIHQLAHLSAGMQYCLSKDRSFDDPLKSNAESTDDSLQREKVSSSSPGPVVKMLSRGETGDSQDEGEGKDDDQQNGNDDNEDEEAEEAENSLEDASNDDDRSDAEEDDGGSTSYDGTSTIDGGSVASWQDDDDLTKGSDGASASFRRPGSGRPIILLPNGLIIYKSISVTCSVHDFTFRAHYPDTDAEYIELVAKGCITEAIWPKTDNEHGLYAQLSTSFVSLQERYQQRKRTLLLGGMQRDDHLSLNLPSSKPREISPDEFFPLFERRGIRNDPLDLRHLFPTQAVGVKTTIDLLKQPDGNGDIETTYKVLHEIGVDEMDVVLDTDAIFRLFKFFLDEEGKHFDPRWHTGDWTDILTTDMLQYPTEILRLDEYLQQPKDIFLDENSMISSDLFNVTARLTNVDVRIPASVQDNLRSCDIILKWKETTLVVSSALPRTFLSGKIGNSITGDARKDKDKGVIDFPNDPSDICYVLDDREDQALSTASSAEKTVSTFRAQLTTRGFEMNIIPIVPFCKAPETQQLIAVGNTSMIFSFEGEPPLEGSNEIKITVFFSVLVHDLLINIDFDLLAGAIYTALYHKKNATAIIETAEALFLASPISAANSVLIETDHSLNLGRVKQTLHGHQIMVRRHISQSRETGGLAIVFCLQQNDVGIRVWRQNIPLSSPLRGGLYPHEGNNNRDVRCIDIVKLVDFEMKSFEIGVDFDFHMNEGRRTVLKCYLQSCNLRVCDLDKEIQVNCVRESLNSDTRSPREWHLLEICSLGGDSLPGALELSGKAQQIAFRLEGQHKKDSQSWSIAADITSPTIVNLHAEAMKNVAILIIEALLLPTWSKHQIAPLDECPFPPGTIGSLFHAVLADLTQAKPSIHIDLRHLEIEEGSSDPIVERALRTICKLLFPSDLRVILMRCEIANFLISIPYKDDSTENQTRNLSLLLNRSDLVTRFYPVAGSAPSDIEYVLACKGTDWSTLINTQKQGFYQSIVARQSLHSVLHGSLPTVETLVHPFELNLTYSGAEMDLSMSKGLLINDIRLIENYQLILSSTIERSTSFISDIACVVSAMKERPEIETSKVSKAVDDRDGLLGVELQHEGGASLARTRSLLRKAQEEIGLFERSRLHSARERDNELDTLKVAMFVKERERFGAVALMASRAAGWIRMGGQHRTGQRVAKSSLLWPYWMVLRKSLLILYPSPGVATPSDILSLENARIRQLAGGKSNQDVKRGFAIIETSGMTRYFVSSSSQEYNLWTKEIAGVIRQYSDATFISELDESARNLMAARLSENETVDGKEAEEGSNRKRGLGNRLASALQSARQKGKDLSERRHATSSDFVGEESEDRIAQAGNLDSVIDFAPQTSKYSNANGDLHQNPQSNYFDSTDEVQSVDTLATRRVQFGMKLSGVGQVTKNRLGSALQTARQKGAEISNRRRRNEIEPDHSDYTDSIHSNKIESPKGTAESETSFVSDHDGLDPTAQSPKRGLQLGSKLGSALQNARAKVKEPSEKLGRLSGLRGKLAGAGGRTDDNEDNSSNSATKLQSDDPGSQMVDWIGETTSHIPEHGRIRLQTTSEPLSINELSNSQESLPEVPESFGGRYSLEAARGVAINQRNEPPLQKGNNNNRLSSSFPFKKPQQGTVDDSIFGGNPMTLKNLHISHQIPPSAISRDNVDLPLKTFEENWIVTVEVKVPQKQDPSVNGCSEGSDREGLDQRINAISIDNADDVAVNDLSVTDEAVGTDASVDTNPSENATESNELHSVNEVSHKLDDGGETEFPLNEVTKDIAPQRYGVFIVKVFRAESMRSAPAAEKTWTYPDVLKVYADVSDAIGNVLPYLAGKPEKLEDMAQKWKSSTASLIDNVLISGRVLGGLLEYQEEPSELVGLRDYQCEAIESFLNSLLKCAMPVDALLSLSEALGICSSTRNVDAGELSNSKDFSLRTPDTDNRKDAMGSTEESLTSRTSLSDVFSLLSACDTELQRCAVTAVRADHIASSQDDTIASPGLMPTSYEPLIPPSLTDLLHDSMHDALMHAMAERDEARAQLIGANVLHVHSLEKERKKNEKLEIELRIQQDIARMQWQQELQQPNIAILFGGKPDDRVEKMRKEIDLKFESFRRIININDDEELMQLCTQLASEITTKTIHALEIERLKAVRESEKKAEAIEKDTLVEELKRVKELLEAETQRSRTATLEAAKWQTLYENSVKASSLKE